MSTFKPDTPEYKCTEYLQYWKKNNFGKVAEILNYNEAMDKSVKKKAGYVRQMLSDKILLNYCIQKIIDDGPAVTLIEVLHKIKSPSHTYEKIVNYRLIHQDLDGNILFREENGKWVLIENFYDIEYIP